ncbi:prolyl 4-hydroxylase subunit alpha-1 isoform X1 [Rhipicephalus microplus]|nr:prolyl 4-hydroxylase subunit alpha-1-like isoform X1 [Rhipicephalus microplus]XP_037291678.1 prolyl 4-hydroxylase subunit alpha-1-like isoform X1 [Rhipicephalus microplus]
MATVHLFMSIIGAACSFIMLSTPAQGEVYTALVDLENLLHTEGAIVHTLQRYLDAEEDRLEKIKKLRQEFSQLHKAASRDGDEFISNPVNAFLLVKKLTADWKTISRLMLNTEGKAMVENITHSGHLRFPDEEDLTGAAVALLRLQDTYRLDTASLAKGRIQGVTRPSPELSAGDCFELGRQSYNNEDHYHTVLWMQEALDRVDEEVDKTADRTEILEYLAFSTFQQGNIHHALKLTNDLLAAVPDHPRAPGNKRYYEDTLAKREQYKRGDDGDISEDDSITSKKKSPLPDADSERGIYERLCRGEKFPPLFHDRELTCQYRTNNRPYLLLQPAKEEVMFPKPRIVIYHDVLSEHEMNVIKTLAQPRLRRATVQNYKSGELETASYRISKSAWLKNEEHGVIARVTRRIEDITGLTADTAEELQVVNYGIGGHYEPHFDFARREEKNAFQSLGTGNRIATWLNYKKGKQKLPPHLSNGNRVSTWLNYMSDVSAGGATVFPQLRLTLWPKKGAAAFWYNLHRSGEGDMLTRHAACPVLAGSKWVSNKWFHERGQEFLRPCGTRINQ